MWLPSIKADVSTDVPTEAPLSAATTVKLTWLRQWLDLKHRYSTVQYSTRIFERSPRCRRFDLQLQTLHEPQRLERHKTFKKNNACSNLQF